MNRITIRLHDGSIGCLEEYGTKDLAKKLADYEDMEDKGLLHKAPCKNGTTIYRVQEDMFDSHSCSIVSESYLYNITEYLHGELNKDWFLDKAKAQEVVDKWD